MISLNLRKHKDKLFTDLFWKLGEAKTRFVINYGGAGSSKSYSQHQVELLNLITPNFKGDILFIRKQATTLHDSCYTLLKNEAERWNISPFLNFTFGNIKRQVTYGKKRILFKGLDDPEKIKSIVGVKRIIVEEASELDETDFLELNRRMRGMEGVQLILLLNPIDERHWIKKRFFDEDTFSDRTTIFKTTYKDNKFLTEGDKAELELLKKIDINQYRIYALGEWGKYKVKDPYMSAFTDKHISELARFDHEKEIRLSFDFNVDNCACVLSHAGHDYIHFFDEVVGKNLPDLLNRIMGKYSKYRHMFKVTGDAAGRSRNHLREDDINSFRLIKNTLNLGGRQFRIIKNPKHEKNRFTCNTILAYHPNVYFNPVMENTIYDMRYVECDQNQKIIKSNRAKDNQKADFLDCFTGETPIITSKGSKRIDNIELGDKILTRAGYKPCIDKWDSVSDVYEFTTEDGSTFKCTKDHKFYVNSFGFLPIYIIFALKLKLWKYTEALNTGNTPSRNTFIVPNQSKETHDLYTGKNGLINMGMFLKVKKFIIRMGTHLTILLKILNLLIFQSIDQNMLRNVLRIPLKLLRSGKKQVLKQQKNGMEQKKGLSGIGNMQKTSNLVNRHTVKEFVMCVVQNMKQGMSHKHSAQTNVNQNTGYKQGLIMWLGFANIVGIFTKSTNTENLNSVQDHAKCLVTGMKYVGKRKVYDITVQDQHEFYANGYLAHNCVRYTFNSFHFDFCKRYIPKH